MLKNITQEVVLKNVDDKMGSVEGELKNDSNKSDDDLPRLEEIADNLNGEHSVFSSTKRVKRDEKKARAVVTKFGFKLIPGVKRVILRKTGNVLFVMCDPCVYKHPVTDNYMIIGEIKVEYLDEKAQADEAKKFKISTNNGTVRKNVCDFKHDKNVNDEAGTGSDTEKSDVNIDPADIELVMAQSSVSKKKAIEALRDNNNDVVNAIMDLTM